MSNEEKEIAKAINYLSESILRSTLAYVMSSHGAFDRAERMLEAELNKGKNIEAPPKPPHRSYMSTEDV